MLGVSVRKARKMKALAVKMETVTVIGNGTWNVICFLADILFFKGHLRFG